MARHRENRTSFGRDIDAIQSPDRIWLERGIALGEWLHKLDLRRLSHSRSIEVTTDYTLETFIRDCREKISDSECPADCAEKIAPSMYQLLNGNKNFLTPAHFQSDPKHYARNAIYIDDNDTLSLFALVWRPGQWTPIHDHGTWGVVGVLEGTLEERSFIRVDAQEKDALENIELVRGGVILLSPGTVTSFVPNPDHIHITGNGDRQKKVVSLHLYGRAMAGFHIYDKETRTRKWAEITNNES